MKLIRWFARTFLNNHPSVRRWVGGRWERWWFPSIGPRGCHDWVHVDSLRYPPDTVAALSAYFGTVINPAAPQSETYLTKHP